jgi:hypothetical protein
MRSIVEWEAYLRSYFQHRLRLIGEIPLRRRDVEELADLISACFAEITQQENTPQATEHLRNRYPHAFTVFLTAFATFNDQLNYWHTLSERINVPDSHINNYRWRHIAYEFIQSKGLPVLSEKQASDKYVATLRFHGGIPIYSLPDFFTHILLPSVQRSEYVGLSSAHTLKLILDRIYNVDAPIINFLKYSGELGEAFFESCRGMARRYIEDQELVTPEELELPTYLVEEFYSFMEASQEQAFHLRKPFLTFNPYDEPYLRLNLPEEQVPLYYAAEKAYWQISWDVQNTPVVITPTLRKQRQDVLMRESSLPIQNLPSFIKVSLLRSGASGIPQCIRRWTIPCLPSADQPLIVARGNGQILASKQELPGETLLLVFPANAQVRTEGEGVRRETYPNLTGSFSGWKAEAWDLSKAQSLHLWGTDKEVCPAIPIGFADQNPVLAGTTCQYNADPNDISLYAGHAPILRIPKWSGRSLEDELKRWKIELRSHWETSPKLNLEATLDAYLDNITVSDENFADFNLSSILGKEAAGTFNLRVQSQYETEAEFRFRIWPSLYVLGLEKYNFPTVDGAQPISFNLRLPEGTYCEIQPGTDGISIEQSAVATTIIADIECTRADLYLVKPLGDNSNVRIPIYIPMPRLRWRLLTGDIASEPEWTTRSIQISIDAVLQSSSPSMHLAMQGIHEIADRVSLLLIDPNDQGDYIQEEKLHVNAIERDVVRLPLSPFRTTLAGYTQSPQLELHLFYRAPNYQESKHVPLVFLGRQLEITNVSFKEIGELTWRLSWNESAPLRNRRVLIRSAWQPWQAPWEFKIPDKARGNFVISNIGLLPSHYRIAFFTAPDSEPPRTVFPEDNVFGLYTCDPEERVGQLQSLLCSALEQDFRRHFETCCILAEIRKPYEVYVNKCLDILKLRKITNMSLLFSYYSWLENHSIMHPEDVSMKANVRALRYWISAPEIVNHVLQKEKGNSSLRAAYIDLVKSARKMYPDTARLLIQQDDDPSVMNICLNCLMENDTASSIPVIFDLVNSARLSDRDAAYILAPKWQVALQAFLQLPETSTRDSLIITLLHYVKEKIEAVDSLPSETILRLWSSDTHQGFHRYYERVLSSREELSIPGAPTEFVTERSKIPVSVVGDRDKNQTINLGQVTISARLLTPAGIGAVVSMQSSSGEKIIKALMKDANFCVTLKLSTGELINLSFVKQTITFLRGKRVYACASCKHFAATDKTLLHSHQAKEHAYQNTFIQILPLQFPIDIKDILVLPPQ